MSQLEYSELVTRAGVRRVRAAGLASAAGEFARAAAVYERIGARPDEAQARLRDAADLVRTERFGEAEEQLHRAEAFFRSVRAAAPLAEIEALLARVHG